MPSAALREKVLDQYPEQSLREKMTGSRWLPLLRASISQEVLETGWCVENEFPLDKNVGLFRPGVRKAAQLSGLCQETVKVWPT